MRNESALDWLSFHSDVPNHAHFVCENLDAAICLASEPPLAGLIEVVWIVGGVQVYKVIDTGGSNARHASTYVNQPLPLAPKRQHSP